MTENYNQYNVTFVETHTKYNPATRTIKVHAYDELGATNLVNSQFDSYAYNKNLMIQVPTGKHIKILKVKKLK